MSRTQSFLSILRRHKWLVVILFFAVMIGFVDEDSMWHRYERLQEIAVLRAEKQRFQNRYEQDTQTLADLESNPEAVVRVAREQYFMKYPNEDVFVVMEQGQSDDETEDNHDASTL